MHTIKPSKIKKMSLQLLVADLERAVEFYTLKLGFEIDFRFEDFYVGIIKDGCSIHLKLGDLTKRRNKSNEDLDIMFSVEGIEGLYEELASKFVNITQSLREMPYGKEFYIADPDGHIIAFVEEA